MESDEPPLEGKLEKIACTAQHYIDKTTIWVKSRWATFVLLLVLYALRIYIRRGFFVITYGLGIYLLNLLIGFLSPAVDPESDGPVLPTADREEYRPFSRKLPEFKFWFGASRAVLIAICMTFFELFELPVFWPILLVYFILLVVLTMKDRIKHMMKHNYVPFSLGKQTYGDLTKVKVPGEKKDAK